LRRQGWHYEHACFADRAETIMNLRIWSTAIFLLWAAGLIVTVDRTRW